MPKEVSITDASKILAEYNKTAGETSHIVTEVGVTERKLESIQPSSAIFVSEKFHR